MAKRIPIALDEELVAMIDEDRGSTSRARWVEEACNRRLGGTVLVEHLVRKSHVASSAEAKRNVRPVPKKG